MTKNTKKRYEKPSITPQGSVDKITLETNKDLGGSDGITFQNNPIHWTS